MNDLHSDTDPTAQDLVDIAVEQWRRERPDLDLSAMGTLARFVRIGVLGGRLVDQTFAAEGLDRAAFNALAALRRSGEPFALAPSQLADAQLTSRGGMTKVVDRLEARGLVRRQSNDGDRRSLLVVLTPEGRALADELVTRHTATEAALLGSLTASERESFDAVLRKLHAIATEAAAGGTAR